MKKSILVAALVCGFLASASPVELNKVNSENVKVFTSKVTDISPLCQSISKNDIETVKKLLAMGANVNKFSGGKSPLMYAARYNRVAMIKLLVDKGAKINTRDSRGNTALKHAKNSGAKDAVLVLEELRKKK